MRIRVLIIAAFALAIPAAHADRTNLNHTVAEINAALGHALDNSNTVTRLDSLETFVAGSNGFSNIEYSTSEISNALFIAEANSNTVARLDMLEAVAMGNGYLSITNAIITNGFSSASLIDLDLASWVGSNSSMVVLEIEPTGTVSGATAYFAWPNPNYSYLPYGGAGVVDLATDQTSLAMCITDSSGGLKVRSDAPIQIRLLMFIRNRVESL